MGTYREVPGNKTRSVTGKVTTEEKQTITEYALSCGSDESTLTRELWLAELGGKRLKLEHQASVQMLTLFKRTMLASLEQGEHFTGAKFEAICAEVECAD